MKILKFRMGSNSRIRIRLVLQLSVFALVLFCSSCKKDHLFDFLKSTGKTVTIQRDVTDNFAQVKLENNVNLVLTQGPSFRITLNGGENLLPGIDTEIKDSILTIRSNNKFNWVRSYEREITAFITAPHFLQLNYESTGTVTNSDTLREDSLFVNVSGGSGYINLCIKTRLSHLSMSKGSADMNISGYSDNNFLSASSYGPFHCLDLHTVNTFMNNAGTNDCFINVKRQLVYEINSLGNIYYSGKPSIINGTINGQGKLIPLE
jgi:hypothetical protein